MDLNSHALKSVKLIFDVAVLQIHDSNMTKFNRKFMHTGQDVY